MEARNGIPFVSLSDTWVISQQNRERERETVDKIVLGRLPRLKLEFMRIILEAIGYWLNLEIGSNLPTLWLDLPCS